MSLNVRQNQSGIVSIMVTMIMILVITLIVLGFAQITRRNQRENLDNQLSTQAFYAAETGVNDAIPVLQAGAGTPVNTVDCTTFINKIKTADPTKSNQLNPDGSVAYTCLNVNNTPHSLQFQTVANGQAITTPLNTNLPLPSLVVSWKTNSTIGLNAGSCASGNQLPTSSAWGCNYGLLRLDLAQDNGTTGAAATAANTLTFFLKPSSGTDSYTVNSFGSATKGVLLKTTCVTATKTCKATINLTGAAATRKYFARISAVYRALQNVTVTSGNAAITFSGSEATVDSTGKAQDVLRRIQVRVSLIPNDAQAGAGLQTTGSICKLLSVTPPLATSSCSGGVQTGGNGSVPGPGNPDGNADFAGCPSAACPSGGGGGSAKVLSWYGAFVNTSQNADSDVVSCTWNWDDSKEGDPSPTSTTACHYQDSISHQFYPVAPTGPPYTIPPYKCYAYNVTLTVHLKSGLVKTKAMALTMPGGSASPCR